MTNPSTLVFITAVIALNPALATTVQGVYSSVIIDWPAGQTGEIRLEFKGTQDTDILTRGTIDTAGRFSIELPPRATVMARTPAVLKRTVGDAFRPQSNLSAGCSGHGAASPVDAHYQEFSLIAYRNGQVLGDVQLVESPKVPNPVGTAMSELVFFERPVVMNGTIECPMFNWTVRFQGAFPAGWNLPLIRTVPSATPGLQTDIYRSLPLSKTLHWRLYDDVVGLGIHYKTSDDYTGIRIASVLPGTPAAGAGLRADDLVVEVNGRDLTRLPAHQALDLVASLLATSPVGTRFSYGVQRGSGAAIKRVMMVSRWVRVP